MLDIRSDRGAARRRACRLAAVCALLAGALPGAAQSVLAGRVELAGAPVPNASLELHRVTDRQRGVIRRFSADAKGAFSVTLPPAEPTGFTVYFATALVRGVRYFGPALHGGEGSASYRIEAFDTTSSSHAADSVTVLRRDVILSGVGERGWEVAELVRLHNPTGRTLVPAQDRPIVSLPLPAGADAFESGEGDSVRTATGDLVRVGRKAWVNVPFVPGDRDFVFRYRLPANPQRVPLPVGRATDSLTIYIRQPAPDAKITGIPQGTPFSAEGETFSRYEAFGVPAGTDVVLDWRGPLPAPIDPRWTALAIAALVLGVGGWLAWRRPWAA
jgi:hypothetical protein